MTSDGTQRMTPACAKMAIEISVISVMVTLRMAFAWWIVICEKIGMDREHHDPHAEPEIAAIDIDEELEQEGQPQPAAAVEGEVALELQLDRRPEREGQRGEEQQPGDHLLERRLPGVRSGSRTRCTPPAAARNSLRPRCLRTDFSSMAVDHRAHDIGRQHRDEVRGIGLDLRHARGQQQRKGHETRATRHHVDEARQQAAGEEEDDVEKVQGGLVGYGIASYARVGGRSQSPTPHLSRHPGAGRDPASGLSTRRPSKAGPRPAPG